MSEHATEAPPQGASTATLPSAEQVFIDSLPDVDESANTPDKAPAAAEAASESEGTTAEADPLAIPDSFTPQDVRGMLESIADPKAREVAEAAYRNLQGDYTKSKQQLAEQAKAFEGLDDLEKAKAAVEFYDGIQNDPEFALEVHGYLSRVFEDLGMTKAEAKEAAADQITQPAETAAQQTPSFEEDPDAALKAQLDSLKSEVDSWKAQDAKRQEQQREDELAADLLRQEMALRSQFEPKNEEDAQRLEKALDLAYDVAAVRGGNLLEAWGRVQEHDQLTVASYMAGKATNVPPAEPVPGSTAVAPEIPRLPDGTPDLEAVHKIAVQKLQNAMAGRE